MAERRKRDAGLIDGLTAELGGPRMSRLLSQLDAATPWGLLVPAVSVLPEYQPSPRGGRPAWPAEVMLRCLLLAKWFGLSDPQLEDMLQDRLSFRRFVGLALTDNVPDETSFVVFRNRLREHGVHDRLFALLREHLDARGLLVKEGTIVDATIIPASRGRARPDGTKTADPDAAGTRKHGVPHFGYKAHVAADSSRLATGYRVSNAREHEGVHLDELVRGERHAVYADAMHDGAPRRAALSARGVGAWICYQRRRGQARLPAQRAIFNHLVSRVRARVEHVFAELKQRLGYRRVRYRGLERNSADICMTLIALNIRRTLSLRAR
jgi:IS5 family transposase